MELLAPAGSPAHLLAALDAGADAVYLGGQQFSARRYAGNFSDEELQEGIKQAHIKGAAVYITLNTLIGDREMERLAGYLHFLSTLPVDGLLVQDLGVAALASRLAPDIPLHASTQMTVTNLTEVRFLEMLGFQRVVLSREVSAEEIKRIAASCRAEIEVFVHGALCVCYSGQCLMSSFAGGRSGNRGTCAQPCRKPYTLIDDTGHDVSSGHGRYIMSMKDLMGMPRLADLIRAGVASLKVEGRMKDPSYVYRVISSYRKAIDAIEQGHSYDAASLQSQMEASFNRGYGPGFLEGTTSGSSITETAAGNRGVCIGKIKKIVKHGFVIDHLPVRLSCIEGISYDAEGHQLAYIASPAIKKMGSQVCISCHEAPRLGGFVYGHVKAQKYQPGMKYISNTIPLRAALKATAGERVTLQLWDTGTNHVQAASSYIAEKASHHITGDEQIRAQLSRLGNSWFRLSQLDIHNEGCMVPVSVLNRLRQEAIKQLEAARQKQAGENIPEVRIHPFSLPRKRRDYKKEPVLVVRTNQIAQLPALADSGIEHIIFGGESYTHRKIPLEEYRDAIHFARAKGITLTCAMPRIIGSAEEEQLRAFFEQLIEYAPDGVQLSHPGMLLWAEHIPDTIAIEADSSWNIFNQHALRVAEDFGINACYVSQELTLSQIRDIAKAGRIPIGVQVYGRTELMVSDYCVINAMMTTVDKRHCPGPCASGSYSLKDEQGRIFPITTDAYCRMHVLNCKILDMRPYVAQLLSSGISRLCIDARGIGNEIFDIVSNFKSLMSSKTTVPAENAADATRGHFFRGVL